MQQEEMNGNIESSFGDFSSQKWLDNPAKKVRTLPSIGNEYGEENTILWLKIQNY